MNLNLTETFTDAHNAGTPIVGITTMDQPAAIAAMCNAVNGAPKIQWDAVRGLAGINDAGRAAIKAAISDDEDTTNPQSMLMAALKLPEQSILFAINAHRFIEDPFVSTGVGNLREPYQATERMMVLLGPNFSLPAELQQDVVIIDDPLPDDETLSTTIKALCDANGAPCDDATLERAVDATRGLSKFATVQVTSMSLRKTGPDIESLTERKRIQINQTKGLTLLKGGPTLDDVQGYASITTYMRRLAEGENPFRCVVWIDEIEKQFGGLENKADGVVSDFMSEFLNWTEERQHDGVILVGPGGTGKSFAAKAVGPTCGRFTLTVNFGAMKGSLVGQSEQGIRTALKTIDGLAAGRALIIATCNKLMTLPPELRRRFTNGIWYFDLPSDEERRAIWRFQLAAHGLDTSETQTFPNHVGWTGAEIRNCCRIASRLRISLVEASAYIVPLIRSDMKSIEDLRNMAEGRFLSASYAGTYTKTGTGISTEGEATRKVRRVG